MDTLKIEELKNEDWKEYLRLRSQLGNFDIKISKKQFDLKYEYINNQNSFIYIGKIDNVIVCTGKILIEIKFGQNVAHIEDVVVDINKRKKGYGKIIVQYLLDKAKNYDCYKTVLQTSKNNEYFYNKCDVVTNGIHMVKYHR